MTQTTQTTSAVSEAENRIEAIRTALANGDSKLTARDLSDAKDALEFAELKAQSAIENERKADLARRTARTREFEKRLKQIADDTTLADSKRRFEKSLQNYIAAAEKHNKSLYEIQSRLADEGLQPGGSNSEGVSIEVKYPAGANQPFIIGEVKTFFTDLRKPLHDFVDSNLTTGV
jgi:small-conductance mechanosensitive channel